MKEYIPRKYKTEPGGQTAYGETADRLVNQESGEWFFLTNRSFKEINHSFAKLPSRTIEKLKKLRQDRGIIRILDIGGGIEARAAEDIANKYRDEKDEHVQVFSLDLTAKKKDTNGLHQIVGEALNLPIKDGSIDMAYSHMSISLFEESDPNTLVQALKETARTLKPGGIFFLDKLYTERLGRMPDRDAFKNLGDELGVVFYSKELGLFLGPLERILNKLNKEYPDWKFIIMIKKPVDQEILTALKLKTKPLAP